MTTLEEKVYDKKQWIPAIGFALAVYDAIRQRPSILNNWASENTRVSLISFLYVAYQLPALIGLKEGIKYIVK